MNNKRKVFKISDDLNRGFTDLINAVKNNAGNFRYEVVALSRIETDPENPREILITENDIRNGFNLQDPNLVQKKQELTELESLAYTIKTKGLINPIVIYKYSDKYRIIAGERRFLAAHIVGKDDIHARIYDERPNTTDLKLLQWIENNERQDLSLREKLNNLKAIIDAYLKVNPNITMTGELLKKLTGLSKTQAFLYHAVLTAPADIKELINDGKINNLEKASLISGIKNESLRAQVINACINGKSMEGLKEIIANENKLIARTKVSLNKKGRAVQYVHLGKTKQIDVVKKIFAIVLSQPDYKKYASKFNFDWNDHKQITEGFKNLLAIIAETTGV